jgi:hypothetical protein
MAVDEIASVLTGLSPSSPGSLRHFQPSSMEGRGFPLFQEDDVGC